jgi:hypothetical protein
VRGVFLTLSNLYPWFFFWNQLHLMLYEDLCSSRMNVDDTAEHFQLLPLVHKEFRDADFIC